MLCTGRRFWNFHRWSGDCANAVEENLPDRVHEISESCSQMVLHFHNQVEVILPFFFFFTKMPLGSGSHFWGIDYFHWTKTTSFGLAIFGATLSLI